MPTSYFLVKQNKVTYNIIKKNTQYCWKLLKPPYKYTKTTILLAANNSYKYEKNIFCLIAGEQYKELKVKEVCVFDYIELLYRATIF